MFINLKNMIGGRSQTPQSTNCMVPSRCNVRKRPIYRHRKQAGGCQGLGAGGLGSDRSWVLGPLGGDGDVLELNIDGCTTLGMYEFAPKLCTLKWFLVCVCLSFK